MDGEKSRSFASLRMTFLSYSERSERLTAKAPYSERERAPYSGAPYSLDI